MRRTAGSANGSNRSESRLPSPGSAYSLRSDLDLPFALPTAVAGIALTAVYAPHGWIGQWLEPLGIQVAFTRLGVFVALTFIGLPSRVKARSEEHTSELQSLKH